MALHRRDFIKFAVGGAIGSLFTPIPWKLADDISIWSQNWPWIPRIPKGELVKKSSVVKLGNTPYGIFVNLVGNRPCTISGNEKHPLSLGGIDPLGASSCALLYSPSRVKNAKLKDKNGKFRDISIDKAKEILMFKLKASQRKKDSILFVSGDDTSSCNEIFSALISRLGSKLFFYQPSDRQKYFKAWYDLLNGSGEIGFDIENSDLLLIAGCNFLDNWGTYVRNQKVFGKNNIKIYFVGPFKNNTSVVSKKSILISERDIYKFLFAIASYLIKISNNVPQIFGIEDFTEFLAYKYDPLSVSKEIGCSVSDIKEIAIALKKAKSPLVIAGSTTNGSGDIKNILAALMLNILLDRINKKGGLRCIPNPPQIISSSMEHKEVLKNDLIDLIKTKKISKVKTAIFYETNPFYSSPKEIRGALLNIPFKVCLSPFMNETAKQCDLIIPTPYFLEKLDDCFTPFGSGVANYTVADKIVDSDIPNPADLFIEIGKKLDINLGVSSFIDIVRTKSEYLGVGIDKLKQGYVWTDETIEKQYGIKIWDKRLEDIFLSDKSDMKNSLELIPISISKLGSDLVGLYPFALDVIYEDEIAGKYSIAYINPTTTQNYHLNENDLVKVKTESGEIIAKIKIKSGITYGAIAILMGFGRNIEDVFNKDIGENIADLFTLKRDEKTGSFYWSPTNVNISKI